MKKVQATLKGIPLTLHLAESKDEKSTGYNSVPIRDGEGMLFRFQSADWIPVDVSGLDGKLDVLWLSGRKVESIAQRMKGNGQVYSGYGDALLELPAGFVEKNGVVLSDRLEIAGVTFTALEPEPKVELGKRRK